MMEQDIIKVNCPPPLFLIHILLVPLHSRHPLHSVSLCLSFHTLILHLPPVMFRSALLPLLIFYLLCLITTDAVIPEMPLRMVRKTSGTIMDVLRPDGIPPFVSKSEFSIFSALLVKAKYLDFLSGDINKRGITVLAPNDEGLMNTAKDIATKLGMRRPKTEKAAFKVLMRFINRYKDPKNFLGRTLSLHLISVPKSHADISSSRRVKTVANIDIGVKRKRLLLPVGGQTGIAEDFSAPMLLPENAGSFSTSNGMIHSIDRLLLPPLKFFQERGD